MSDPVISSGPPAEPDIPSTQGMTTKVVKGSIWTLAGTVAPLLAAFVSTPFIIRFLGSEAYGVLILVSLIPNYFAFADFGMGIASTKFGSEAYGKGDKNLEGEIVRTAALIALVASLFLAVPLVAFSLPIVTYLNVPAHWQWEASAALKIATVSFVLGILSSIFNTPQLSRLRMDLNSLINASCKLLLAIGTPVILYLGGKVLAAVITGLVVSVLMLLMHIFTSHRQLPELFGTTINRNLAKPLLKFGGGLLVAGVAAILLVNLEKVLSTKLVSVRSLAYYSVAFTFANMAAIFSLSMVQSLIPAFSQLLSPEKREEFNALYARGIRFNLVIILPLVMVLFVIAAPFFTLWAGPEFGERSTLPFYILLVGLVFNMIAYIPHTTITAAGRTDIFAKVYWIELPLYILLAILLVTEFGIKGAALAWAIRVIADTFVFIWLARTVAGVRFPFIGHLRRLLPAAVFLMPPMLFVAIYGNYTYWILATVPISISLYGVFAWNNFLKVEEKEWLIKKIRRWLLSRPG